MGRSAYGALVAGLVAVSACSIPNPLFGDDVSSSGDGTGDDGGDGPTGPMTSLTAGPDSTGAQDESGSATSTDTGDPPSTTVPSTSDETGEQPIAQRCAGLLWGVNGDAEVILIDLEGGPSNVVSYMQQGSWAVATMRSGMLIVAPMGPNINLLIVDPRDGGATQTLNDALPNDGTIARAAFHSDHSLWLGTHEPAPLIRVDLDLQTAVEVGEPRPPIPPGGDHTFADDKTLYMVGFDGNAAILDVDIDSATVTSFVPVIVDGGDVAFTSLQYADEILWAVSDAGVLYEITARGDGNWFAEEKFPTGFSIDDISPVFQIEGACPR